MSTNYYLLCQKCTMGVHIAQDGLSGFTFYYGEPNCMRALKDFLSEHSICGGEVVLKNEHFIHELENCKEYSWASLPHYKLTITEQEKPSD